MSNTYESSAFIYPQRADAVIVNRTGAVRNNVKNVYKPFKIAKGIDTEILFYVRDISGKPQRVADKTFTAKILKSNKDVIVLTKELYKKTDMSGVISLRIFSYETFNLDSGLYNIILEMRDTDGVVTQIYVDESYKTNYVLEILDSKISNPVNISDVDEFFQFDNQYSVSNRQPGSAQFSGSLGVSTVVFYTTNFTGEILLEATLESTPAERDWFPLKLTRVTDGVFYTGNSGIDAFVVEGKYYWFRVKYTSSSGSLDKVLISL